jgi:predicted ATPase
MVFVEDFETDGVFLEARRFITFIDACYESKVYLLLFAPTVSDLNCSLRPNSSQHPKYLFFKSSLTRGMMAHNQYQTICGALWTTLYVPCHTDAITSFSLAISRACQARL